MKELTDATFEQETASGVSLTDFWAEWCGPCKMQSPILEEMSEESDGSVAYYKLDVDANPETPRQFGIMSIPTLLVKKDGEVVETLIGLHSKEQIAEVLSQYT
ncbi:MAG TPA: thioredoxin [Atopostipes sp.]|jgi:thioredoxin|nr:thioredoxin [Atopostipes sp.]